MWVGVPQPYAQRDGTHYPDNANPDENESVLNINDENHCKIGGQNQTDPIPQAADGIKPKKNGKANHSKNDHPRPHRSWISAIGAFFH